jgi:outer membrane receptor protein involved in Fe transport
MVGAAGLIPPHATVSMLLAFLILASSAVHAEESASSSEEVVVVGERLPGREDWDTPAAVSVFTIDASLRPGVGLGTLVNRAPGVVLQRFGDEDDFQGVSIRGAALRQVAVHIDGIPLNPEGGEAVDLSRWPLRALERVEVYRGFAPASLGGAAIGGAIDLIPRQDPTALSGGLAWGSQQRLSADAYTGGQRGSHSASLFAQGHHSEGLYRYFSDNGTPYHRLDDRWLSRTNNDSGQGSVLGRAAVSLGAVRVSLVETWMRRSEGMPGHVNNPSEAARMDTWRNLAGARASVSAGDHQLSATAWWLARSSTYDDRGDELGLGAQWLKQAQTHLGLRLHEQWVPSEMLQLGLSASGRAETATSEDLQAGGEAPPLQRTVETLTADMELARGGLGVTPVVHGTFLQGDNLPPLVSVEPRLGLRYRLSEDTVVRATGGRYLRPPDMSELFGDRGSMLGNPDLKPERGWQWDVGARHRADLGSRGHLQADLGHFWTVSHDRIVWVQNSQRTMIPQNFGRTWVQGVEASLAVAMAPGLGSDTAVSFTRSRNLDTTPSVANMQLPGVPTWSIWQEFSWSSSADAVRLAADVSHTDGNYWDATNWYLSAPRTLVGVSVQAQPGPRWPSLQAGVSNILDTQVAVVDANPLQPAQSARVVQPLTDFAGHPLPGRTWTLGLRWDTGRAS